MLNRLTFLTHETVILNNPGRETLTAGLGPIEQYSVVLVILIILVIVIFIRRRKKKNN